MPKRTDRDEWGELFDGNPYAAGSPHDMYESLRWGDSPTQSWDIDAPEPLVALGELAGIKVIGNPVETFDEHDGPFVAIGQQSNMIWLVPRDSDEPIDHVPEFDDTWRYRGRVNQIDYYSDKGGEPAYYYHRHENPLPFVYQHADSGVLVIVPANNDGQRSYAVGEGGIVG